MDSSMLWGSTYVEDSCELAYMVLGPCKARNDDRIGEPVMNDSL